MDFLPLYLLLDLLRFNLDEMFSFDCRKKLIDLFLKYNIYVYDIRYIGFVDKKNTLFIETRKGRVILNREDIAELQVQYIDIGQLLQSDCFKFYK